MKRTILTIISVFMLTALLVPMFAFTVSADEANPEPHEHYVLATDEEMKVDGNKEASYLSGCIFYSELTDGSEEYKNSGTMASFTAHYIWDGKGKVYCFVEVKDPEVVVNTDLWSYKWWHCASWQMYIDFAYTKKNNTQWTFVADESGEFSKTAPDGYKVVMTDSGFNVEFCFDFLGMDFLIGDQFGFGLYYNDAFNYKGIDDYKKHTIKNPSAANPSGSAYQGPGAANQDCMILSANKIGGGTIETAPPVVTTEEPVVTTEAPVQTTEAPVQTTEAPVVTTEDVKTPENSGTVTDPVDDGGCGSFSVSAIAVILVAICGVAVIRKKD